MSRNQFLLTLLLSPRLVYGALNAGNTVTSAWNPPTWPAEEQFALTVSELDILNNAVHTHDCVRSRPPLTVSASWPTFQSCQLIIAYRPFQLSIAKIHMWTGRPPLD